MTTRTVGGTLVSRICGLSPWGGPLSAFFELTEDVQAPRTQAMGRGNALEASVLALYREREKMQSVHIPNDLKPIRAPSMPHAHATLDALEVPAGGWVDPGAAKTIVDAKTSNAYEMAAWGADGSDKVPDAYTVQLQWYGGVCRAAGVRVADEMHIPVLSGPETELQWAARLVERTGKPLTLADLEGTSLDFRVCRVEWDAALFAALNERVCRFLAEHVVPRIPPMPGPGDVVLDRDAHAVAKGIRASGLTLDYGALNEAGRQAFSRLLEAAKQKRAWEAEEDAARVGVQLLMGGCEDVAGLPDGSRVTWKGSQTGVRRFVTKLPKEER